MTSTVPAERSHTRFRGLDGLRAIAVLVVVAYHLFPPAVLTGGFIGVDVFFVISGFLITSLLLRERAQTGRIALGRFWQRRARRLLPALALVVAVCSSAAWIIGGDVLVRIGEQVLGAATFSYNWIAIAGGDGYFAADTPELFRNFWSLAVEEQFYLLWPLVLPLFLLLPRAWVRSAAALVLAGGSAVWMALTVAASDDPTRAYFGTDTHAFGLLLGVALAFVLAPVLSRPEEERPAWMMSRLSRGVTGVAGMLAVAGIVTLAAVPPADGVGTFPGALLAASLCAAVVIVAGVWPGSWLGPAIDVAPLRWVGDRSYGIYLWHWPLLVLAVAATGGNPTAAVPVGVGAGVLIVTLIAAELSYRFIETPVRRDGFRATAVRLLEGLRGGPQSRLQALGATLAGALVLAGTGAALAASPEETSAEAAVSAGRIALEKAALAPTSAPTPAPTDEADDDGIPDVPGDQISAVGDSVMLASAAGLLERLPGITIDAEVSRSIWAGPGIVDDLAARGELRPHVVVALGTNGPVNAESLERIAATVGSQRDLVLVNAYAPRDWIPGVNADLAAFAAARPNVAVADWAAAIAPHEDLLAGDRIHPGDAGGRIFAETVADAVDELAQARRDRHKNFLRVAGEHLELDALAPSTR